MLKNDNKLNQNELLILNHVIIYWIDPILQRIFQR